MKRKYFNYWAHAEGSNYNFENIFVSQETICKKHKILEEWNTNPLTIRLCLLQEAFENLFSARLSVRQKTSNPGYVYHENQVANISGITSSMIMPQKGYIGETFYLELHYVYKNFYAFCSFFSAVLDRLASEINLLYGLGNPNTVDWRKFVKSNGKKGDYFSDLFQNNPNISNIVLINPFSELLDIRNAFEHGKKIEIGGASFLDANFDYILNYDSKNYNVVGFSKLQILNLLNMCEDFYKNIKS